MQGVRALLRVPSCISAGAVGGRRGTKHLDWFYSAIGDLEAAKGASAAPAYPPEPLHGRRRARVFFDFQWGRERAAGPDAVPPSRVVFELADDIVPLAAQNFVAVSNSLHLAVRSYAANNEEGRAQASERLASGERQGRLHASAIWDPPEAQDVP